MMTNLSVLHAYTAERPQTQNEREEKEVCAKPGSFSDANSISTAASRFASSPPPPKSSVAFAKTF